jgi:DNA topoisomerase-3
VVENSGIQKQFKIIKNYSTKPNWSSTAGCRTRRRNQRVMNEASIKGSKTPVDFIPTTEAIKRFSELKPSANYDNLYYAGFSRAIGDWLLV